MHSKLCLEMTKVTAVPGSSEVWLQVGKMSALRSRHLTGAAKSADLIIDYLEEKKSRILSSAVMALRRIQRASQPQGYM